MLDNKLPVGCHGSLDSPHTEQPEKAPNIMTKKIPKDMFEGFKRIDLTEEQARLIFSIKDDMEMFKELNRIYDQQNPEQSKAFEEIRTMLGDDNQCTCPDCMAAKNKIKKAEEQLKINSSFPDFMNQMLETFGQAIKHETKEIEDERDNLTKLENDLKLDEEFLKEYETSDPERFDISKAYANFDQELTEPMPSWALCPSIPGTIEDMSQLLTRDGRRIGNAVIFKIDYSSQHNLTLFHIVTDAGNILTLTFNEMNEMFYEPKWIMKALPNDDSEHVSEMLNKWMNDRYGLSNYS